MAISGKNLHQVYMTKLHLGVLYGCRWIYKQAQRSKARHTCPMNKPLTLLLWAVLLLELLGRAIPLPEADFVLKPLLMPILVGAFLLGSPKHSQRILVTAALFFSWLGDIFLLFEGYFVFGLASFLIAHIMYVVIFQKERGTLLLRRPWISVPFLLLTIAFYWFARKRLGSMTVPVLGYITVICMMALAAINRYGTATQQSFQWTVAGALFFMSSDLMIGIDKFITRIPMADVWIMLTYVIGQYAIVRGISEA